jgi:hypothetical protein
VAQRPSIAQLEAEIPPHPDRDDVVNLCRPGELLFSEAIPAEIMIKCQTSFAQPLPFPSSVELSRLPIPLMPVIEALPLRLVLLFSVGVLPAISLARKIRAKRNGAWSKRSIGHLRNLCFVCH